MITKLISVPNKWLYWPVCRAYARYVLSDKAADGVMRFLCSVQFWKAYHFWPNFVGGSRFSEKLWSRMLHDRDPILTLISDKLLVREYVAETVGGKFLVPILWNGIDPKAIPFEALPTQFVIKTNHGCGYTIIVAEKAKINIGNIKSKVEKWLGTNFCTDTFLGIAWGYKNIKPTIIVEEFIGENGKPPLDYKFYCFEGRVEIVTIHFDRFEEHMAIAVNRNFTRYTFRSDFKQYSGEVHRPANFDEMVSLAESLAEGFDFIRVDLYNRGGKIYFGEFTPYPSGISTFSGFDIESLDDTLGSKWKKAPYPENYLLKSALHNDQ